MNFRQKITLYLFLTIVLGSAAFAQVVEIPDPNLHAVIRDALNLPGGTPITRTNILRLEKLEVSSAGITDLQGLEAATNLEYLDIGGNPLSELAPLAGLPRLVRLFAWECRIGDITPLSNLTTLKYLDLNVNRIVDISAITNLTGLIELVLANNPISNISPLTNMVQLHTLRVGRCEIFDITPLANLTRLRHLDLSHNDRIVDINPLANLTSLVELLLWHNRIVDVSPLAHLTNLELLYIEGNRIVDLSPLDMLSLSDFRYDDLCEMLPSVPVLDKIGARTYPSVFTFWAEDLLNRPDLSYIEKTASHDLWCCPQFGVDFKGTGNNIKMGVEVGSLDLPIQKRDELLSINPNMIFIVQIRMREAYPGEFPEDSPYLVKDANGDPVYAPFSDVYLLNFTRPDVQELIINEAIAVSKCGLFDGIFFDHWTEDYPSLLGHVAFEAEQRARDIIVKRIRAEARPDFLIMGNTNDRIIPRTAPYINGGFMESAVPKGKVGKNLEDSLTRVENSLNWLEQNTREPRINCLQGGSDKNEPLDSPANLRWMRAITALGLTYSDGYVVFSVGAADDHNWYDFWEADLGRPVGPKSRLYDENISGLYIREFTNGWAVYNHSGEAQIITLPEEAQGVASGLVNTEHALPNLDGEMYLRLKPKNPADVNRDGVVNILDLTIVAQALGTDSLKGDVNGDGVVNVFDLVFVADQF